MRYHYSFVLKAETGDNADSVSRSRFGGLPSPFPVRSSNTDYHGSVFYEAVKVEPSIITQLLGDKTGEGSGTAFVVHSDGYLVTCEHVIRSAAKVEVTINQRTFPARVLAADRKHDLAVLKIDAKGLKALALGNSDQVQLAEEVRAVGFPLSDVLGTSVKVTRGTISGVVDRGEKLLQIDASINPGNSGGPLVNAKGEVMGVCSSGLFGESISHVGFAVPAKEVQQLLQAKGYPTNGSAVSAPLEGPELARQVTPGVAFVKVTIGADVANACLLEFNGMTNAFGGYGGMNNSQGQVLLTRDGEITSMKGDSSLPFLVGTYGGLVIDKLPYSGETSWESRNVCSLSVTTTQEDTSPFGGSFPGRLGGRFRSPFEPRPQQQTTVVPAVETTSWKLGPRNGNIQLLNKHYEFATSEKDKDTKLVEMSGDGTVSFDVTKGIPQECKMTFNYRGTRGNVTVRIPITFSYQLYGSQTREEWLQQGKEALAKSKADREAASTSGTSSTPSSSLNPAKQDNLAKAREHLEKIGSATNPSERYVAMSNLGFMEPIAELRDDVSKAIDPYLTSKDRSPRQGALGAVKKWFTEHNVPSLLKLLDSLDDSARRSAIECLGLHSKDPKIAVRIAECLKQSDDRYTAEAALKKMGAVAEDAVLPLLADDDEEVRSAICDVLRETGTAKCIPELEKLAESKSNRSVKSRAESALREINRRLGKKG
jgi:S1-C subfamily serine protease